MKKKTWRIFLGLSLVLIAVALILEATGILASIMSPLGEVSVLAVIGGIVLLVYAISRVVKLKIAEIFVPLALIFMLFEGNIAFALGREDKNIINNWLLLGCAILLWIGIAIIMSVFKRKKERKDKIIVNGHGSMGASVRYINCDEFTFERIENDLGSYTVYFDNTDKYTGGGVLEIYNNIGAITVNVPSGWNVVMKIDNSLAHSSGPDNNNPNGPSLTLIGDNNLGNISVEYV